jgi:hypothetical protein
MHMPTQFLLTLATSLLFLASHTESALADSATLKFGGEYDELAIRSGNEPVITKQNPVAREIFGIAIAAPRTYRVSRSGATTTFTGPYVSGEKVCSGRDCRYTVKIQQPTRRGGITRADAIESYVVFGEAAAELNLAMIESGMTEVKDPLVKSEYSVTGVGLRCHRSTILRAACDIVLEPRWNRPF